MREKVAESEAAVGQELNANFGELMYRLSEVTWCKCLAHSRHPELLRTFEFSYP